MQKQTVSYVNLVGVPVTKDFYFHISKVEASELRAQGYIEHLEKVMKDADENQMGIAIIELILKAYGTISDDGDTFIKSEEATRNFKNSVAFDAMLTDIMATEESIIAFLGGIIPINK